MARTDVTIRVDGLRRLRRDLRAMGDDLTDLKDANAAAARIVAAAASSRAPRRSGRLAASVRGNRAVSRASVMAGGASVPYAGPIHWGWPSRNIDANPFVSDAAVQTEAQWIGLYERDIEQAVDKVAGNRY